MPFTFNGYNFDGKALTAVGWGTTSYGGEVSKVLLKTQLTVINHQQCAKELKDVTEIGPANFCTFGDKSVD